MEIANQVKKNLSTNMKKITEQTVIKTRPEKIWEFLVGLHKDGNYKKWHPQDHIKFVLVKGDLEKVGSIASFEEHIGKIILKGSYKVTHSVSPRYLEYSPAFPLSLLKAVRAYFKIEPINAYQTKFTAYAEYGYNIPLLATLFDWIVELFVKREDIEKHMHEEGENLKQILEEKNLVSIGFSPDLIPLILDGTKTTTYRYGNKYTDLEVGSKVYIRNSETNENIAIVELTDKSIVKFKDLPLNTKGHEEYVSREEQQTTFKKYYGKEIGDDENMLVLRFNVVEKL